MEMGNTGMAKDERKKAALTKLFEALSGSSKQAVRKARRRAAPTHRGGSMAGAQGIKPQGGKGCGGCD